MAIRISSLVIISTALSLSAAIAQAQGTVTQRSVCQNVGPIVLEPLGESRALQVASISCRIEGGPMNGAVMTGDQVYEFQGLNGKMIVGAGVLRMPGNMLVYQNTEASTALTMVDGKVTGATGSGKGVYKAGYGATSSQYTGKTYTYSLKTTGLGAFVLEIIND